MVNPLARVVMNNVIKKTEDAISYTKEKEAANLTNKEEDILKDIISKEEQVKSYKRKPDMITLDEAVERIKDGR